MLEREGNIDLLPPVRAATGDQTLKLGMCLGWASDHILLVGRDDTPTNWATQPGLFPELFHHPKQEALYLLNSDP